MLWLSGDVKNSKPISGEVPIGFALGTLVAFPALMLAFISAGAGHGDYAFARALFPASMLLTLAEGQIGPLSLTVGFLQFPIYGGLCAWAMARRNYLPVIAIAIGHLIAAVVCFTGVLPNFS